MIWEKCGERMRSEVEFAVLAAAKSRNRVKSESERAPLLFLFRENGVSDVTITRKRKIMSQFTCKNDEVLF